MRTRRRVLQSAKGQQKNFFRGNTVLVSKSGGVRSCLNTLPVFIIVLLVIGRDM